MRIWVDADACPNMIKEVLFRAAVRDVRPLRQTRPAPTPARKRPRAASRRADQVRVLADSLALDAADLGVETGEELAWRRAGVPESVLRRLQRGQFARRDELARPARGLG